MKEETLVLLEVQALKAHLEQEEKGDLQVLQDQQDLLVLLGLVDLKEKEVQQGQLVALDLQDLMD